MKEEDRKHHVRKMGKLSLRKRRRDNGNSANNASKKFRPPIPSFSPIEEIDQAHLTSAKGHSLNWAVIPCNTNDGKQVSNAVGEEFMSNGSVEDRSQEESLGEKPVGGDDLILDNSACEKVACREKKRPSTLETKNRKDRKHRKYESKRRCSLKSLVLSNHVACDDFDRSHDESLGYKIQKELHHQRSLLQESISVGTYEVNELIHLGNFY